MKYPQELQDLIDSFMLFPGIGPKTAERLALHAVLKVDKEYIEKFSKSLIDSKTNIRKCDKCGNICTSNICDICKDESREKTIMVVESCKEVISFEKINAYHGRYHVLNGLISPMNGISAQDVDIDKLLKTIEEDNINKVIIAISANIAGETTAMYINNLLKEKNIEVYRIGYGLPVGADIEYADEITLSKALEGIKKL